MLTAISSIRVLKSVHIAFVLSEVQSNLSVTPKEVYDSCMKNRICINGVISTPVNFKGSILQTLNMKIRYVVMKLTFSEITEHVTNLDTMEAK